MYVTTVISIDILFVLLVVCVGGINAASLHSIQMSHYDALIDLYNSGNYSRKDFIPKANVSNPMYVNVAASLLALTDFNEVAGSIDLMISLELKWTDEIPQCNNYSGWPDVFNVSHYTSNALKNLLVPHGKIWSPDIVLVNGMDSDTDIGGTSYKLRLDLQGGEVKWQPKVHVQSSCSPDITYYPFDKQNCNIVFVSWGHVETELVFRTDGLFNFDSSTGNGEWDLENTGIVVSTVEEQSRFILSIEIKRRPLYFAFNIISPIMVLVILNGMVFWLPVESGERVGFSVTCFLSFVVLLNMIMGMMPESSSPIAYLCFYTVCMMLFSGLNTALVILQMQMFYKPETDKVPEWLTSFIRFMKCQICKRKGNKDKISIVKVEPAVEKTEVTKKDHEIKSQSSQEDEEVKVTWQDVSESLDMILFLCFIIGQTFFTVLFLIPLFARM